MQVEHIVAWSSCVSSTICGTTKVQLTKPECQYRSKYSFMTSRYISRGLLLRFACTVLQLSTHLARPAVPVEMAYHAFLALHLFEKLLFVLDLPVLAVAFLNPLFGSFLLLL